MPLRLQLRRIASFQAEYSYENPEMPVKLLSVLGIVVAVCCLGFATTLYPGGFDWNRDFISTLLRGPAGQARMFADVGVLIFCLSLGLVFARLAKVPELSPTAKAIRIGGIGSMVYAAMSITPMHDLMVSISLVFLVVALFALLLALKGVGEIAFFIAGCCCLAVLLASAAVYYSSIFVAVLPWAQRVSFAGIAVWLVALDWVFPRVQLGAIERMS